MPSLAEIQPVVLERFLAGWFYSDPPDFPPPTASLFPSINMIYDEGMIQKRPGDSNYQSCNQVLSGRLQKTFDWIDNSGNQHLFVVTTTNLYHYNNGTGNFDSFMSGLSGTPDIVPSACSFFGKIIFANGGDKLFQSDGTSGGTAHISTAPVLDGVAELGGRVIGFIQPTTIQWSNSNDQTNWTTGSAGTEILEHDEMVIQGMLNYRSQIMVGRLGSMWVITPTTSAPFYDFASLVDGLGTYAGASMASTPNGPVFLGPDNLYLLSSGSPQPVGIGARVFIQNLNLTFIHRSIGVVNPSTGRYYCCLPYGTDTDVIDLLMYDYQEGYVAYWQKVGLTGLGVTQVVQPLTWASLTQPWSAYTVTWGELGARASQNRTLYLKNDGVVYQEDIPRQDTYNGGTQGYTMIHRSPFFAPYTQAGLPTNPTPTIIEMVEVISQGIPCTASIRLGWSYGNPMPTYTPFRTVSLLSGRNLLGFPTKEAPYWQYEIQHSNQNENCIIRRLNLWTRQRRQNMP